VVFAEDRAPDVHDGGVYVTDERRKFGVCEHPCEECATPDARFDVPVDPFPVEVPVDLVGEMALAAGVSEECSRDGSARVGSWYWSCRHQALITALSQEHIPVFLTLLAWLFTSDIRKLFNALVSVSARHAYPIVDASVPVDQMNSEEDFSPCDPLLVPHDIDSSVVRFLRLTSSITLRDVPPFPLCLIKLDIAKTD
jgi:hypothetical protein